MARETMIPVTNVGIWEAGVAADEKSYERIAAPYVTQAVISSEQAQERLSGFKIGVAIWGTLSAASIGFWLVLGYFLLP